MRGIGISNKFTFPPFPHSDYPFVSALLPSCPEKQDLKLLTDIKAVLRTLNVI